MNEGRMKLLTVVLTLLWLCQVLGKREEGPAEPKIAIIGAGIGGTATAFFLRELFGKGAAIDVYEADAVGGRLRTNVVAGHRYEEGGSIIHPRNRYMKSFVNDFELSSNKPGGSGKFGFYDGHDFVFTENSWSLVTLVKLFYRYGSKLISLDFFMESLLEKFDSIYDLQERGRAFESVWELLVAADGYLANMTKISTKDGFTNHGLTPLIIDEIVMATLRANYGQSTDVDQFVGSVSVAGGQPGVWSVTGGNYLVAEKLLERSGSSFIQQHVNEVKFSSGKYDVKTASGVETYDIVIISTPIASNVKTFELTDMPVPMEFPGKFHMTVNTMVHGLINKTHFGWRHESDVVDEILTVNDDVFFNAFAKITPVDWDDVDGLPDVWKIFSPTPLTQEQLNLLFSEIYEVITRKWYAYPHYSSDQELGRFQLYHNLYYVNAIEWAASAMEMSCIGAKNVALLTFQKWHGMEQIPTYHLEKDEL